jgi:hypothetical protein
MPYKRDKNDCSNKNGHFCKYLITRGYDGAHVIVVHLGHRGLHAITWIPGKGLYDATHVNYYPFTKFKKFGLPELKEQLKKMNYHFEWCAQPTEIGWYKGEFTMLEEERRRLPEIPEDEDLDILTNRGPYGYSRYLAYKERI